MALSLWSSACAGLRDLVPEGPVLSYAERLAAFPGEVSSGARYTGPARGSVPLPPVQVFGVTYDVDLVLRTRHPSWDMHEYARIATPDGPLWLAKDARAGTKEQSIVADLPDLDAWLPEVPVVRRAGPVQVDDRSTADSLDVQLRYTNLDGQPVEVSYAGPMPKGPAAKRNTSTMGHSAGEVAAVLDLSHKAFARRASVTIGGERQAVVRILGLVPFQLVLAQTQAGFSVGDWSLRGAVSEHAGGHTQDWQVSAVPGGVELTQAAAVRTLRYRFVEDAGALELVEARVEQFAHAQAPCVVRFYPAIPDGRRAFDGEVVGRFVIDVGGQPNHGVGRWVARREGEAMVVELRPEAPRWLAERPMRSTVVADDAGGRMTVVRVEPD